MKSITTVRSSPNSGQCPLNNVFIKFTPFPASSIADWGTESEVYFMSEREKKILETFSKAIPGMSELEKEKLLAFGEGMAFMVNQKQEGQQDGKRA